jgi:hypothetical protein
MIQKLPPIPVSLESLICVDLPLAAGRFSFVAQSDMLVAW